MLTPEQIHRRALNRYADFLRAECTGQPFFPLAVFGAGMSKPKDFVTDRDAIRALQEQSKEVKGFGYEITWEERNYRRMGLQKVPGTVVFPTRDDYVRHLRKHAEVLQFQADYALVISQCPELETWAQAKPRVIVNHAGSWRKLLDVCSHLKSNPRPGCYVRELPVAVDTKFVENNRGILSELLPIVAPLTVGADLSRFETRFGFRFKQPLLRIRFLDNELRAALGFPINDFAAPLDEICNLPLGGNTILIVENEMTFLTLPQLPGTLAIYGAGDAAALLAGVKWLGSCRVFYWGDLDSHGFETLSNLRQHFASVTSILMDEETLADHRTFAVTASETRTKAIAGLTPTEQTLYDKLVETGVLLEQERIPDSYSKPRLSQAVEAGSGHFHDTGISRVMGSVEISNDLPAK